MKSKREIIESPLEQGTEERITYSVNTTPWGSSPSNLVVKLFLVGANGVKTDVSDTCLTGSASAEGEVISTPAVSGLVSGMTYRLEIRFMVNGNLMECYAMINGRE